jgi:hypothetical protein
MESCLCGSLLAVTILASPLMADDVLTTTNMDGGYVSSGFFVGVAYTDRSRFSNESAGQTFFPQVSGRLTTLFATVDLWVGGEPLQVGIYTADESGLPDVHLGTAIVPETDIVDFGEPGWPLTMFDLSSLEIDLVGGEAYVVTFRANNPVFENIRYRALRTAVNANSYGVSALYSPDFGATWFNSAFDPELGLAVYIAAPIPEPQEVAIDVDPDSSRNPVNLKTRKPKPLEVAVLGDANLNVSDIVAGSALLGDPDGSPVAPASFDYRDVDGDGDTDLVYEFDVNEMKAAGAISESTTTLYLEAGLTNGGIIFGTDEINRKGKG